MEDLLHLIETVSLLDRPGIEELLHHPNLETLAVLVILLAGISMALGQSVVLFINRVTPLRFVLSLLISGIGYALWFLIYALAFWLTARYSLQENISYRQTIFWVFTGHAPMVLGFLIFIPYLGILIRYTLQVLTFFTVTLTLSIAYGEWWIVSLVSLATWIGLEVLTYLVSKPLSGLKQIIWFLQSGRKTKIRLKGLLQDIYRY